MKKLLSKISFAMIFVPLFLNQSIVLSMNQSLKTTHIPTKEEISTELERHCNFVKESVDKDTQRICEKLNKNELISDDEWKLDSYQIDQTSKLENNINGICETGKIKSLGYCSTNVFYKQEISLLDYAKEHVPTCDKNVGVCRNFSSKLWLDLYQKGIYCGLMFCKLPCSLSLCPDHVAVILAIKEKDDIKYYVSDSRSLQSSFNLAFLLQNGKHYFNGKLENIYPIVDYNKAWEKYVEIARKCKIIPSCNFHSPLDFLLIPLDEYINWLNSPTFALSLFPSLNIPISIATNPNDILNVGITASGIYIKKVGPKTLDDFKKEVEEKIKNN